MYKPKVFIGSSTSGLPIANSVQRGLAMRGCGDVTVWDKDVFGLNRGFLETLVDSVGTYDFAVLIWSAADALTRGRRVQRVPRDNVVFETGLFMGAMGRDRVFVVYDKNADLKIPSDFAGVAMEGFDGPEPTAPSISRVCARIAREISKKRFEQYVGVWRSRYAKSAYKDKAFVNDDVDISAAMGGILITSRPRQDAQTYSAYGRVHAGQQILGEWRHEGGGSFISGLFMLAMDHTADMMSGYCTARTRDGALVFETWVLAKKNRHSNAMLDRELLEAERELKQRTVGWPRRSGA